jgi:ammonia channel protein AmtB
LSSSVEHTLAAIKNISSVGEPTVKRALSTSRVLTYLWSVALIALALIGPDLALAQDTPAEPAAAEAAPAEAAPAEAAPAEAAAATAAPSYEKGDIAWMLTSTLLVIMMVVPGLALFYGGMVRSKNILSISMQIFVTFSLCAVLWCIYGYSIAFTNNNAFFGGFDRLFLKGLLDASGNLVPGGTVVHINAGIAGLVGCLLVGKRKGYGSAAMPPHNLPLVMVGAALLWVGWFGFNVGSNLEANAFASQVFLNTFAATAAAVVAWAFGEWNFRGTPTMLGATSGAIAGLVAITPACGWVGPMGAIVIGVLAGLICLFAVTKLKHALGYDDSLDVFGVHGVGGLTGTLLAGVFAVNAIGGTAGLLENNPQQVLIQLYGVAATLVWSAGVTFVLLKLVGVFAPLRVSLQQELEGLDISQHGEALQ